MKAGIFVLSSCSPSGDWNWSGCPSPLFQPQDHRLRFIFHMVGFIFAIGLLKPYFDVLQKSYAQRTYMGIIWTMESARIARAWEGTDSYHILISMSSELNGLDSGCHSSAETVWCDTLYNVFVHQTIQSGRGCGFQFPLRGLRAQPALLRSFHGQCLVLK